MSVVIIIWARSRSCFLCFSFIFSPFIAMMIAIITSGEEERLDIDRRSERKPLEEGEGGRAILSGCFFNDYSSPLGVCVCFILTTWKGKKENTNNSGDNDRWGVRNLSWIRPTIFHLETHTQTHTHTHKMDSIEFRERLGMEMNQLKMAQLPRSFFSLF